MAYRFERMEHHMNPTTNCGAVVAENEYVRLHCTRPKGHDGDHRYNVPELPEDYLTCDEGIKRIRQDLKRVAEFLEREGFTKWGFILLNIEQSVAAPASYRRLP